MSEAEVRGRDLERFYFMRSLWPLCFFVCGTGRVKVWVSGRLKFRPREKRGKDTGKQALRLCLSFTPGSKQTLPRLEGMGPLRLSLGGTSLDPEVPPHLNPARTVLFPSVFRVTFLMPSNPSHVLPQSRKTDVQWIKAYNWIREYYTWSNYSQSLSINASVQSQENGDISLLNWLICL